MNKIRFILSCFVSCLLATCATMPEVNAKVCYKGACVGYNSNKNVITTDVNVFDFLK